MNRKTVILVSLLSTSFIFAQSVEGTVTDRENKPAAEAEVLIIKDNAKFSAITDEKGMFKIPLRENGNYLLAIISNNTN